jgi:hypothetical protein
MSSVLMLVVMSTEWNGGKDGTFEAHVFWLAEFPKRMY